jgi:hypothetical protein
VTALLLSDAGGERLIRRSMISAPSDLNGLDVAPANYDERWLQILLYNHPELVILDKMEPGAGAMVPLCRELSIPRESGLVFLDLLGVTRSGNLVLVECKLWRNPQARREVVAQILEYAALMRSWSYGDLTARLKQKEGWSGANPIYDKARALWPDLEEAAFVDGVSASLAAGRLHLIIAGDGIRSDLQAIAAHLNGHGAGAARLSLLEIQLWGDSSNRTVVVPSVPLRTEIIEQRVIIADNGLPIQLEQVDTSTAEARESAERVVDPEQADRRLANKRFWQRFIDTVSFDHPDQSSPTHGGNNWVKIGLEGPAPWLTAYRTADRAGLFLSLSGDKGQSLFEFLQAQLDAMRSEGGLELNMKVNAAEPFKGELWVARSRQELATDGDLLAWLCDTANRMVTLLRPRLALWQDDQSGEPA